MVDNHFKSWSSVVKGNGLDPAVVAMEIKQDMDLWERLGIPPVQPVPVPATAGPSE